MYNKFKKMAQSITLETYIFLEKEFGKAIAEKVTTLLDFSFAQAEKKVEQIATQKKLEIKDELSKELASKADIATVKADIAVVKSDLLVEIERLESKILIVKSESRLFFIILLCAMIVLNRDNITLIAQLLGLLK